jgi:hypothetical protein
MLMQGCGTVNMTADRPVRGPRLQAPVNGVWVDDGCH